MAVFEYNNAITALGTIEIEDTGNFAVLGVDKKGFENILIVQTILGFTTFYSQTPLLTLDTPTIKNATTSLVKKEYKMAEVEKDIKKWMYDKVDVQALTLEEAISKCVNFADFITLNSNEREDIDE